MQAFLTLFLPLYFALFFGIAFLWRSWRTWKETGVNPYTIIGNPGVEQVTSRYFRLLPLACLGVMAAYLFPGAYDYLAPFAWLESTAVQFAGLLLMSLALLLIVVAQGQMGASVSTTRHRQPLSSGDYSATPGIRFSSASCSASAVISWYCPMP